MRLDIHRIVAALGATVLLLGALGTRATAESFNYTYPLQVGQTLANSVLLGSANTVLKDGQTHVSLTEAVQSQRGTWILSGIAPNRRVTQLEARFEVGIDGRRNPYFADGISINFAPNLTDAVVGEDGVTRGLAISIQTFDNGVVDGVDDTAPSIEVHYDGTALGGVFFDGYRRQPVVPGRNRRWNPVIPYVSLDTGSGFVPMRITLQHDESSGMSFVSVVRDGVVILSNIQIPYTPASDWQIAFGARTGSSTAAHSIRNVVIDGSAKAQFTVTSAFGANLVHPPVGSQLVEPRTQIVVTAPSMVYLDRFRRELGGEEASTNTLARYRARLVGSTLNGRPGPSSGAFVSEDGDATLTWNWELENLAEINTGTEGIPGLVSSDVTDAANAQNLGRHYRKAEDTTFDSVVYRSVRGDNLPVRFAAKGFVVENVPNTSNRFLELSGTGDHFRGTTPFTNTLTGADGRFTLGFWSRVNPGNSTRQTVVAIGTNQTPSGELGAGFAADRSFFVTDGSRTVSTAAGLSDSTWHHWAVVNDPASNEVRIFRDGIEYVAEPPAFGVLKTDGGVNLGAALQNDTAIDFFAGGLNDLRIWPSAFDSAALFAAMTGGAVPDQTPSFQFDADPTVTAVTRGTAIEKRTLAANLKFQNADDIPSWTLDPSRPRSNTNGLVLPTLAEVPLEAQGAGRIGWIARTLVNFPTSGTYRFLLTRSGMSRLRIDDQLVLADDMASSGMTPDGTITLNKGLHLLEVRMIDPQASATLPQPERILRVEYETLPKMARGALPLEWLSITARDLLADQQVVFGTRGPNTLEFRPRGFEPLLRPSANLDSMQSAIFPGFLLGSASAFGQNTAGIPEAAKAPMNDWRRVFWLWEKQYRMQVSVTCNDPAGLESVRILPFVNSGGPPTSPSTGGSATIGEGVVTALDVWVGDGRPMTVGTIYRTEDRAFTLESITANLNLFGKVTMKTLQDAKRQGRVTREYAFPVTDAPGQLVFNYSKTRHRAALAIGESLDVSSVATTSGLLLPDLPSGVVDLRVTQAGPSVQESSAFTNDGGKGGSGNGWEWDFVGKRWFPLRPGRFTLTWPDTNGYTNTIEITADFPTVVQKLTDWEQKDGSRYGTFPSYALDFPFPALDAPFPGVPTSHYDYAISQNANRLYPADLDPSPEDRWKFLRLAYSEQQTASVRDDRIFTEQRSGVRSVLVYSQRAPDSEAATGDLSQETILVRVLKSRDVQATEVATAGQRLTSSQDLGGFRSGYIISEKSNYNPIAYDSKADAGQWGPIFPVNNSVLQTLSVGWYDNPSRFGDPPGALPKATVHYNQINWPNPATAEVIYIASRMGSEGVGQAVDTQTPNYQEPFDPARISDPSIYNQPDRTQDGFNPNEEHAFVERSISFQLTGDPRFNRNQQAAYALQHRINRTDTNSPGSYTSEPWVLVQYRERDPIKNPRNEMSMRAFRVLPTREPAEAVAFPATDPTTRTPFDAAGNPVPQPANPRYIFQYSAFAGSPVVPPHPLNLAIGNIALTNSTGGNVLAGTPPEPRRTLWFDRNHQSWVVSGDGLFFQRFWYPLRGDFWFGEVSATASQRPVNGTPIAWNPIDAVAGQLSSFTDSTVQPVPAFYDTLWKADHPILKRGETLTFPGGEAKIDSPARPGLPGVLGWASAEVVFDSGVPSMALNDTTRSNVTILLTRPLDRFRLPLQQGSMPADLQPARTDKVMVSGGRWYFKELAASLGGRFYYDPLAGELVLSGRLNGKESGTPDLTVPPIGPYTLEANRLAPGEEKALQDLAPGDAGWKTAVTTLVNQIPAAPGFTNKAPAGIQPAFFTRDSSTGTPVESASETPTLFPLRSLGIGAAVVPSAEFLSRPPDGQPRYVTLVENNDPDAGGAVSLQILQIGDERFRGSIAVIDPPNVFDEKIELQHTADFGGITGEVFYQWYVRDISSLDSVGTPDAGSPGWQLYQQGLGLSRITFTGRPDITLADKFFFVRYGGRQELQTIDAKNTLTPPASVVDSSWRLVPPDALNPDWSSGGNSRIPYQWAGAANSPQLQADGSRRFLPQLVMGWVKRVLDGINPFEARFKATFAGDSPATLTSMLQQAGRPYIGPVAFNADRDSLERVGLIELYETVLNRAKDLTQNASTPGTDQAILLAATRLALLYDTLGAEAYSDAMNPSIPLTDSDGNPIQSNAQTYLFAFDSQVPSLLEEELALLRGTDLKKSYPVFNRLFWNYTRGLGEAAYNINYHIQDVSNNGLINAEDASLLYPMGHGDAWGHQLSALKMHYDLLRRPGFQWQARSEYYSLLGNVIPTDYLDEKSFAKSAARRALTGISVVKGTYRSAYVADPAAQWQGYTDLADPARAWGVSEWAGRVGHGALFDWVVANAITPALDGTQSSNPVVKLDRIDRSINRAEIGSIGAAMTELDQTLGNVNRGQNPLGFDDQAMAFDVSTQSQNTPFEQILERAIRAGNNAQTTLNFSTRIDQSLRNIASGTADLQRKAVLQDFEYRNRLIGLLGTPYEGTIGPGQLFKEGYVGPDLITYAYVDEADVDQVLPNSPNEIQKIQAKINSMSTTKISDWNIGGGVEPMFDRSDLGTYFNTFYLTNSYNLAVNLTVGTNATIGDGDLVTSLPYVSTRQYGFTAPAEWGRRRAPGAIQVAIKEMLGAEIALRAAIAEYQSYLGTLNRTYELTHQQLEDFKVAAAYRGFFYTNLKGIKGSIAAFESFKEVLKDVTDPVSESSMKAISGFLPNSIGVLGGIDAFFPARGAQGVEYSIKKAIFGSILAATEATRVALNQVEINYELKQANGAAVLAEWSAFRDQLFELAETFAERKNEGFAIPGPLNRLNMAADRIRSLQAEALRLQQERTAYNMQVAALAQRSRYEDLAARMGRNEAARQYDAALETALRYTFLALQAYDYETSLSETHPASVRGLYEELMRTRQLGLWSNTEPQLGNGGLAEILAKIRENHRALKPQLGLQSPQIETGTFSLRTEMLRVPAAAAGDAEWKRQLGARKVADLWELPEYAAYCRPFVRPETGPQPGLVIEFQTSIEPGKNLFGNALQPGDRSFSTAEFATKIRSHAVAFPGYDRADTPQLSSSPRIYLVPVGMDRQRASDSRFPEVREWKVLSQRIPTPFVINPGQLASAEPIVGQRGVDGSFVDRVRFSDFRAFTQSIGGPDGTDPWNDGNAAAATSSRLYGRSVWNTRWLLLIPGATLGTNPDAALQRFVDTVQDIEVQFQTYSNPGM